MCVCAHKQTRAELEGGSGTAVSCSLQRPGREYAAVCYLQRDTAAVGSAAVLESCDQGLGRETGGWT